MINCSSELRDFHDHEVNLPEKTRELLREHRKANETRLISGLESADHPKPFKFVKQGSYAMRTIIQHPKNDYDIDDGALFRAADLTSNGIKKTPQSAKEMVCEALQDEKFDKSPEVRDHCVRVFYKEGHHIDVPVYRTTEDGSDYEIAGPEWRPSNPEGVTKWFETRLELTKSSDDDGYQMRRLVRLLKAFGRSRPDWRVPTGFIITVLTDEAYSKYSQREDEAFHDIIKAIHARLESDLTVNHPVVDETLTKTANDPEMVEFRDRLAWAIQRLQITLDSECTKKAALEAWADVFNTTHFDQFIGEKSASALPFSITSSTPTKPVDKRGGGRFG
jgi:hypothetical protein